MLLDVHAAFARATLAALQAFEKAMGPLAKKLVFEHSTATEGSSYSFKLVAKEIPVVKPPPKVVVPKPLSLPPPPRRLPITPIPATPGKTLEKVLGKRRSPLPVQENTERLFMSLFSNPGDFVPLQCVVMAREEEFDLLERCPQYSGHASFLGRCEDHFNELLPFLMSRPSLAWLYAAHLYLFELAAAHKEKLWLGINSMAGALVWGGQDPCYAIGELCAENNFVPLTGIPFRRSSNEHGLTLEPLDPWPGVKPRILMTFVSPAPELADVSFGSFTVQMPADSESQMAILNPTWRTMYQTPGGGPAEVKQMFCPEWRAIQHSQSQSLCPPPQALRDALNPVLEFTSSKMLLNIAEALGDDDIEVFSTTQEDPASFTEYILPLLSIVQPNTVDLSYIAQTVSDRVLIIKRHKETIAAWAYVKVALASNADKDRSYTEHGICGAVRSVAQTKLAPDETATVLYVDVLVSAPELKGAGAALLTLLKERLLPRFGGRAFMMLEPLTPSLLHVYQSMGIGLEPVTSDFLGVEVSRQGQTQASSFRVHLSKARDVKPKMDPWKKALLRPMTDATEAFLGAKAKISGAYSTFLDQLVPSLARLVAVHTLFFTQVCAIDMVRTHSRRLALRGLEQPSVELIPSAARVQAFLMQGIEVYRNSFPAAIIQQFVPSKQDLKASPLFVELLRVFGEESLLQAGSVQSLINVATMKLGPK